MKTYVIALQDWNNGKDSMGKTIDFFKTNTFNQKELTDKFNEFCRKSTNECSIDYYQKDDKYAYISMLLVHNIKGVLKEVMKNGKYRSFNGV